ncbi:MAG: DMT family transporter [Roseovarius sp.]
MSRHPLFGILLATAGALFLTPDALFMRLSGMDGFQMVAWRGMLMGSVMVLGWAVLSRDRRGDIRQLGTGAGVAIMGCQLLNSIFFCLGIASAPAAVVLIGVAAVPVCSALLSRVILAEPTRAATWVAMAAVMAGIAIAVSGGDGEEVTLNLRAVAGAGFGLAVALMLALNFTILRARPGLPIMLVIGVGAWMAGLTGLLVTGADAMTEGRPWAMMVTGAVILPVSFFTLSLASRHTQAANVSLLMLLETVLAPVWVWIGVGERPTLNMAVGGAVVVVSLAIYLIVTGRGLRPKQAHG